MNTKSPPPPPLKSSQGDRRSDPDHHAPVRDANDRGDRDRHSVNTVVAPRPGSPHDHSGVVPRPSDFEHFVRIDAQGTVLGGHGQIDQLAAVSAYACSVADVIGQLLQFGPTLAVEAKFGGGLLLAVREPGGHIVGLKPHARTNLHRLRAQLGL